MSATGRASGYQAPISSLLRSSVSEWLPRGCSREGSRTGCSSGSCRSGLVFASVLSFWVDADRVAAQDAARHFGISAAATQSAMSAIAEEHHARWYFLLAGLVLLVWFGIGVVRALNVAHSVAWSLRPEKLRRPLFAGLAFSGIVTTLIVVSASTQYLREQYGGTGLWLTVSLFVVLSRGCAVDHGQASSPKHVVARSAPRSGARCSRHGGDSHRRRALPRAEARPLLGALRRARTATVILLWLYLLARLLVAAAFLNAALWERRTDGEWVHMSTAS